MAQEQESASTSNEALMYYMGEFDDACARVNAGLVLPIEDEATKESCMMLCQMANMARMGYAVLRNNQDARQPQVGPNAFQQDLPDA